MHREIVVLLDKDKIWSCCLLPKGSWPPAGNTENKHSGSSFPPLRHLGKKGKVEVAAWECCPVTSQGSQPKLQVQCTVFPVVCSQSSPECLSLWGFPCTPGISSRDAAAPPGQQQIQKLQALNPVLEGVTVTCSYLAGQVQGFPCE